MESSKNIHGRKPNVRFFPNSENSIIPKNIDLTKISQTVNITNLSVKTP